MRSNKTRLNIERIFCYTTRNGQHIRGAKQLLDFGIRMNGLKNVEITCRIPMYAPMRHECSPDLNRDIPIECHRKVQIRILVEIHGEFLDVGLLSLDIIGTWPRVAWYERFHFVFESAFGGVCISSVKQKKNKTNLSNDLTVSSKTLRLKSFSVMTRSGIRLQPFSFVTPLCFEKSKPLDLKPASIRSRFVGPSVRIWLLL